MANAQLEGRYSGGTPPHSWVEIDLNQFRQNLSAIRNYLSPNQTPALVVKCDAYGHGILPIAKTAQSAGINQWIVSSIAEGLQLREADISGEIILLLPIMNKEEAETALKWRLTPVISSARELAYLEEVAERLSLPAKAHIDVDTGMGRLGLRYEEAEDVIRSALSRGKVKIVGILSHFPAADREVDFSRQQICRFNSLRQRLEEAGINLPFWHIANSAGILNLEPVGNLVRVGLLAYGHYPAEKLANKIPVLPIMSIYSRVVLVKTIKAGESVGYLRRFIADRERKIAYLPIGYSNGFSRRLSEKGAVIISGKKCPVVGIISMDITAIEVTGLRVEVGDRAVVMGEANGQQITAEDIAQLTGTINYEVLTSFGRGLPRIYRS